MNKLLLLCAATLLLTSFASAQDTPHYELFVGGSYLRVHTGGSEVTQLSGLSDIQYQPHNINLNQLGWDATLIENVNSWIGGEVDVSGYYGSPGANFLYPASQLVSPAPNFSKTVPVATRYLNAMFGPRFNFRRGRFVYFFHVPVGIAHVNTSLSESAIVAANFTKLSAGTLLAGTGAAVSPGIGMEIAIRRNLMIQPFQLDYLLTHVFGARQDNARVSAGLNFTFGEK